MERITEIFVILENRPSTLGELCSHLAENEINIEAIGVFHDTAKIYVKNLNKAVKLLDKLNYTTEHARRPQDRPGEPAGRFGRSDDPAGKQGNQYRILLRNPEQEREYHLDHPGCLGYR